MIVNSGSCASRRPGSKLSTPAKDSACCVCLTAAWQLGARPFCSKTLAVIIQERTSKHAPPAHWFGSSSLPGFYSWSSLLHPSLPHRGASLPLSSGQRVGRYNDGMWASRPVLIVR